MSLGFGIVGCGMIARFHARAIAELRGARLVGCYSRGRESATRFASEWNCRVHDKLESLLADPQINIISICTPSGAHLEPAVAAAQAKKHIVIEKPLEVTLKRCDAIIRAAAENEVIVSTIFPSRFHDSAQYLKKAIEQGRFGRLTMGNAYVKWYRTQQYYDSGAWRGTWKLDGGGALMNQAIHSVDLLLWFMGPVISVAAHTATLAHENIEVEDVATATLQFANGALGTIEATTAAYPGYLKQIDIHGATGSAILKEEDLIAWDFAKSRAGDDQIRAQMSGRTKTGGGAADPAAIGHHAHARQFKDVLQAIRTGRRPLIDGEEGRRSVEVIGAIYQSAKAGKRVSIQAIR